MATTLVDSIVKGISRFDWNIVSSTEIISIRIDLFVFRLKSDHADRPATYQEILSSPAMISLPTDVTEAEQILANQVIPKIPPVNGYED